MMNLPSTIGPGSVCDSPGYGGRSSAEHTYRWRCSGRRCRRCLKGKKKTQKKRRGFLFSFSLFLWVKGRQLTHISCTDVHRPRCGRVAGVCTCTVQAWTRTEARICRRCTCSRGPGRANTGGALQEPPRSRSGAACTCTRASMYISECVGRQGEEIASCVWCRTCVCRNTACRARRLYSLGPQGPRSSHTAGSSAAGGPSSFCRPRTAPEWTGSLRHHRPRSFKNTEQTVSRPTVHNTRWCFFEKSQDQEVVVILEVE